MKKQSAMLPVLLLTACCVGPPQPQPDHSPRPVPAPPAPTPAPAPAPVAVGDDWRDWPITPGDWTYRAEGAASAARFGVAGAPPAFTVRCSPAAREITLSRPAAGAAAASAMTITTSYGAEVVAAAQTAAGAPVEARLPAASPLFDRIAFSRGRFMVAIPGVPRLIAPAWPEVTRMIEDCR